MKLLNLDNLQRENQDELYDLTEKIFVFNKSSFAINRRKYKVSREEEMRLDVISENIYGTPDYVDFLCNLNNIKNPLLVREGMIIYFVPEAIIEQFRPELKDRTNVREKISNDRKKTKIDPKREKFKKQKSESLPPSVTKKDFNPVKFKDGKVIIGNGVFGS